MNLTVKTFWKPRFSIFLISLVFTGCASDPIPTRPVAPVEKRAWIKTVNDFMTVQNLGTEAGDVIKIKPGLNTVNFDGPVLLKRKVEPKVKMSNESKLVLCLGLLPICPVVQNLMADSWSDEKLVEFNCKATLSFEAVEDVRYITVLEVDNNEFPYLRIKLSRSGKEFIKQELTVCTTKS